MREFIRRQRSILLRGSCCAAVVVALVAVRGPRQPRADAGARIGCYEARIGGPATYPAYARLGGAYLQKARETGQAEYYGQAERYLEQSIRFQRNFEAARWLAAAYSARHKFQQALPLAREAVSAIPADLDALGTLFDAYLGLGERQSAAAVLAEMRGRGPSFAADARLAALRQAEGNLGEAIQAMERACAAAEANRMIAGTRAWCQVEAGFLHFRNGEPKSAERAYARALEILPGYHHARKHRADLRRAEGGLAQAAVVNGSIRRP